MNNLFRPALPSIYIVTSQLRVARSSELSSQGHLSCPPLLSSPCKHLITSKCNTQAIPDQPLPPKCSESKIAFVQMSSIHPSWMACWKLVGSVAPSVDRTSTEVPSPIPSASRSAVFSVAETICSIPANPAAPVSPDTNPDR